jgi:Uma2 family endonuclease
MKTYRRTEGVFARATELLAEHNDALTPPLFPGFSVTLTEIFASVL